MESENNPLEPFLSSIQVVKNAYSPIESNFRNFVNCLNGVLENGIVSDTISKKRSGKHMFVNGFVGKFKEKGDRNFRSKSDNGGKRDGNLFGNCLHFDVALPFTINGFVQSSPFKVEKKWIRNLSNEDSLIINDLCKKLGLQARVDEINRNEMKVKEGKDLPFECFIGFVFDQLNHLLKFGNYESSTAPMNQFDHFRTHRITVEGKRDNVNGFLRNLKFARVGGVPSNIVGVPLGDEGISDGASKAATVPPIEIPADSVLKSALAGGLSCAFSTALMHPVDTIKTQVQASTLTFPEILSKLPQLGVRGLYMGSIPAIFGQFFSHGLRTGLCEISKLVLINVAPTTPKLQVESMASFFGTFLGTAMRIPCEVLKQRLQAGQFDNVGKAIVGTWKQDGFNGFFRGTGATLCREIPFYVAGTGIYTESKKAFEKLLGRELEPWEAIMVGAISGGMTAVSTTPLDVIKTRMMIATQGQPVTLSMVVLTILRNEGPFGLFKGAVPRFFWVAPLGAINFAGYELARKAMDGNREIVEALVLK
ncbi:hypothetical protein ACJIZ3_006006 [Penstemon smallii]|uniref:Uncharacterized protein n=1 Tax=Penstemon smallii TaxID=265156 RepID=A0ABD3S6G0_9LAMI